jgi:hypothetical protein
MILVEGELVQRLGAGGEGQRQGGGNGEAGHVGFILVGFIVAGGGVARKRRAEARSRLKPAPHVGASRATF